MCFQISMKSVLLLLSLPFMFQCKNRSIENPSVQQQASKGEEATDEESKGSSDEGVPSPKPTMTETSKKWKLVWSDEFSEEAIDLNKWSHEVNCWGGGNEELQCYTDSADNSFVKDGILNIVAIKGESSGPDGPQGDGPIVSKPYSSARLSSKNKFSTRYGRICARAKLPVGQGLWPAIWMLPNNPKYTWAVDGEIDIMEAVNLPANPNAATEVHGTLHYGGEWPKNVHSGQKMTIPAGQHPGYNFHTYCTEWEEGELRWFVDDKHFATQREWYSELPDGTVNPAPAPFTEEFFILLNVAVGGNWPGPPDANSSFPQSMQIEWIRVYECEADPETGKGCSTVGANDNLVSGVAKGEKPDLPDLNLFLEGVEAGYTLDIYDNNAGIISISILDSGDADRGQVWNLIKTGVGPGNGFITHLSGFLDLGTRTSGFLEFDLKVLNMEANASILIKLDSGWPNVTDVSIPRPEADNTWKTYRIPLADFVAGENSLLAGNKVNINAIKNPFVFEPRSEQAWHVHIDNIRFTQK